MKILKFLGIQPIYGPLLSPSTDQRPEVTCIRYTLSEKLKGLNFLEVGQKSIWRKIILGKLLADSPLLAIWFYDNIQQDGESIRKRVNRAVIGYQMIFSSGDSILELEYVGHQVHMWVGKERNYYFFDFDEQ